MGFLDVEEGRLKTERELMSYSMAFYPSWDFCHFIDSELLRLRGHMRC